MRNVKFPHVLQSTRTGFAAFRRRIHMVETKVTEKIPRVPVSILKKRKTLEEQKKNVTRNRVLKKKSQSKKRDIIIKKAESFVSEYRMREREEIRCRQVAKKNNSFYVPEEAKLALVVRIKGIPKAPPDVRKTLQLLRLRQINSAVFVKINKATVNMLRLVEPYISWG
ncbi:hypothetical protein HZS_3381 [Henneguya salminicola]|nr:hypothetical protein HZS_3381 [Henneguya salminicola]